MSYIGSYSGTQQIYYSSDGRAFYSSYERNEWERYIRGRRDYMSGSFGIGGTTYISGVNLPTYNPKNEKKQLNKKLLLL